MKDDRQYRYFMIFVAVIAIMLGMVHFACGQAICNAVVNVIGVILFWIIGAIIVVEFFVFMYLSVISKEKIEEICSRHQDNERLQSFSSEDIKSGAQLSLIEIIFVGVLYYLFGQALLNFLMQVLSVMVYWLTGGFIVTAFCFAIFSLLMHLKIDIKVMNEAKEKNPSCDDKQKDYEEYHVYVEYDNDEE